MFKADGLIFVSWMVEVKGLIFVSWMVEVEGFKNKFYADQQKIFFFSKKNRFEFVEKVQLKINQFSYLTSASAQVQYLTSSCTVYIMIQWIFYIFLLFLSFYSSSIVWCWWLKAFNFTFSNGPIALMSNKNPKTGRKYFLLLFF